MSKNRPRSLRRNLLAVCTFLLPLAALAWLGQRELQRQSAQVRSALDREALQFLSRAKAAVEQPFAQVLPELAAASAEELAAAGPARSTRRLRARGFAELADIVLLDEQAQLLHPQPGPQAAGQRSMLPFDYQEAQNGRRDHVLRLADLLLSKGHREDAARHLQDALDRLAAEPSSPSRQQRLRDDVAQIALSFRLATIHRAQDRPEPARALFERVRELTGRLRQVRRGWHHYFEESFTLGLLAELMLAEPALAEDAADPRPRLALLQALAAGERDAVGELGLRAVGDRCLAGIDPASTAAAEAGELRADLDAHLHARAFAAEYDGLLRETVRYRLDATTATDGELRTVITPGPVRSLLVLRPRQRGEALRGTGWVGLRLDLDQLLAPAVEPFRSGGRFVLTVSDGEDQPIFGPPPAREGWRPPAPADYTPPAMLCHGMQLRVYPADVDGWLAEARAAADASMLLLFGLVVVATIGALWLWRSVSRESELLALKVDLLSRVSHELKTPLALISLYGETLGLKRARDADQAARFGGIIAREAGRLTTMIQRILDFSRREAGTLDYQAERTDLGEALREVAETYSPHLEAKGAKLEADLPRGIAADVDRSALGGVLVNLLENAVKYAREEDPDLLLRLELRARAGRAEIDVLDRGRGVPPDERESVFASFYRASNAGEVRGAGLGLSLVRHFAEAHGGTATVAPRPGGGSIFRISLPLAPATPSAPDAPPASNAATP